jgi:hypothetical protein
MGFEVAKDVASTMQRKHGCGAGTAILFLESLLDFKTRRGRFPVEIEVPRKEPSWEELSEIVNPELVEHVRGLGEYGTAIVKEGKKLGVEYVTPKAVSIPLFVSERGQNEDGGFTLEGVMVMVVGFPLTEEKDVIPLMELGSQWFPHPLLIVAPFIAGKALDTIRVNRVKGVGPFYCLSSKEFHGDRCYALEDIAGITGARILYREFPLSMVDGEWLGFASKIEAGREQSFVYVSEDRESCLDAHLRRLEAAMGEGLATVSSWQRDRLKQRIAALDCGLLEVRVCGSTAEETKWKIERMEGDLAVLRSATSGVVEGVREWLDTLDPEWWECCRWWEKIPLSRTDPSGMWEDALVLAKSGVDMLLSTEVVLCQTKK